MHVRRRVLQVVLAGAFVMLVVQACGAGPSIAPSVPAAPSATPLPTASPTVPPDAAPLELQGRWRTMIARGDYGTLIIGPTSYTVTHGGPSGGGEISVVGDVITFKNGRKCPDVVGTYRWAIAGDTLTLTQIGEPDRCPRADVLLAKTFQREG